VVGDGVTTVTIEAIVAAAIASEAIGGDAIAVESEKMGTEDETIVIGAALGSAATDEVTMVMTGESVRVDASSPLRRAVPRPSD
jgi:hypothetical protein